MFLRACIATRVCDCSANHTGSLGDFVGGNLLYFADDDGETLLQDLPEKYAESLDTRSSFVLFDGRRAHSVCELIGERYSREANVRSRISARACTQQTK